jgi:hypothetical protein
MVDIVLGDITNTVEDGLDLGAFERLMTAVEARLDAQYAKSRIVGEQYATVYLGAIQTVLQQAVLFALQLPKVNAEVSLLDQKTLSEQSQILDTVNGSAVAGVIGAQVALYNAQEAGFARDAEQKVLKILLDTWNIQRTTDDTLVPPTGLADTSLNAVIDKAKLGIAVT